MRSHWKAASLARTAECMVANIRSVGRNKDASIAGIQEQRTIYVPLPRHGLARASVRAHCSGTWHLFTRFLGAIASAKKVVVLPYSYALVSRPFLFSRNPSTVHMKFYAWIGNCLETHSFRSSL